MGLQLQVSHRAATRCLRGLGSHLKAQPRKDLLPRAGAYWQDSVPWWLLSRDCHQFPTMVVCFIKVSRIERARETASKMELTISCDILWKWHCIIFDTIYRPALVTRIAHKSRRWHRAWIRGDRDLWSHLRVCLPQSPMGTSWNTKTHTLCARFSRSSQSPLPQTCWTPILQ